MHTYFFSVSPNDQDPVQANLFLESTPVAKLEVHANRQDNTPSPLKTSVTLYKTTNPTWKKASAMEQRTHTCLVDIRAEVKELRTELTELRKEMGTMKGMLTTIMSYVMAGGKITRPPSSQLASSSTPSLSQGYSGEITYVFPSITASHVPYLLPTIFLIFLQTRYCNSTTHQWTCPRKT